MHDWEFRRVGLCAAQESFWNFSGCAEPPAPVVDVPGTEKELDEVAAQGSGALKCHADPDCDGAGPGTAPGQPQPQPSDLLGLDVWPGALSLCNYLATHPHMLGKRCVLELGAGTGLPGLLAAKLGAQEVLLTDYEPLVRAGGLRGHSPPHVVRGFLVCEREELGQSENGRDRGPLPTPSPRTPRRAQVLDLLEQNIRLNGVEGVARTAALDWAAPGEGTLSPRCRHACHVLLAADVLYEERVVLAFVGAVQALLHPEGLMLVAHQTRRPLRLDPVTGVPELAARDEPFEAFLAAAGAAGLVTRQLAELDVGGSAGPLFLLALAWDASYISHLDVVA